MSHNSPPSLLEDALRDDTQNCGVTDYVVSYVAVFFTSRTVLTTLRENTNSCCVGFSQPAWQVLKGERGRRGNRALARIPPLLLFPFKACHTGHVIKCGEMRGYRSLPHVNIARSTGSRTRNCSNRNPAGKIKIPLSRNTSYIQSLHRKLMLACADTIVHRASTVTCAQG